jgi:hypothetical protein
VACFDSGTVRPIRYYLKMDKHDEYRKRAQEALEMADQSRNPSDKDSWLRIARSYLEMLPKPRQTAEQRFDANTKAKGTGQTDSEGSH